MKQIKTFFARFITYIFIVLFAGSLTANAEIKVVTTIKPLHSLISNVMDGVGEPSLIIEGSTSPHSFVLKPSHAKMIEQADIIFWIGEDIETFMEKPLESIAKNAKKISFMELTSIEKLKFREENIFDHDDHDDHGHGEKKDHDDHGHGEDKDHDDHGHGEKKDHDDHGHGEDKDHDDHGHGEKKDHDDHGHGEGKGHDDHGHGEKKDHDDHGHGHEGHNHGEFDAHIWLDPANAKEMLHEIAHELADLDPDNASKYESNADQTIKSIDQMIKDIDTNINKDAKFIVFHDAYQYFETRFGVMTAGALTLNTDVLPGAKQISEIQEVIEERDIKCIFSEPQFNPKIIETIAQDTGIKTGVLDPLGSIFDANKMQYFKLINDLGNKLKDC
ncbi:zinc ABC transporter substrate-binding protein [SAR116 cluster bacterium]|nr:zinc ABC transporter substrate-binding protein [SAR116 cluster bacterium]